MAKEKLVSFLDGLETGVTLGLPILYFGATATGQINISPEDFWKYRPDLWAHRFLGYGLNKVGRRFSIKKYDSGRTEQLFIGAAFAGVGEIAKEGIDLLRKGYDPEWSNDYLAGMEGALAEYGKSFIIEPVYKKKRNGK